MNAHIQHIDERVLGVAVFVDANVIETFIDPGQDEIEFTPEATPGGILLRVGGDRL